MKELLIVLDEKNGLFRNAEGNLFVGPLEDDFPFGGAWVIIPVLPGGLIDAITVVLD